MVRDPRICVFWSKKATTGVFGDFWWHYSLLWVALGRNLLLWLIWDVWRPVLAKLGLWGSNLLRFGWKTGETRWVSIYNTLIRWDFWHTGMGVVLLHNWCTMGSRRERRATGRATIACGGIQKRIEVTTDKHYALKTSPYEHSNGVTPTSSYVTTPSLMHRIDGRLGNGIR